MKVPIILAKHITNHPSDTENNAKDHCKAIPLWSGKEVDGSKVQDEQAKEEDIVVEQPKKAKRPNSISFPDNPLICTTPLFFPQRFHKKKLDAKFSKFLEIFKKIHINIDFVNMLEQMPSYVKFIKDIMSK